MIVKWGSSGVLAVCLATERRLQNAAARLEARSRAGEAGASPEDARYASPDLPALAFDKQVDPAKALMDAKNNPSTGPCVRPA